MNCPKCKTPVPDGTDFCPNCGAKIKKSRRGLAIGIIVAVVVVCAIAVGAVIWWQSANAPAPQGEGEQGDAAETVTEVQDMPEVEQYTFRETVLDEIDAATSPDVPTASALLDDLSQRGFSSAEVEAYYDLTGASTQDQTIAGGSDERYPLYEITYVTPSNLVWVIYVSNGSYLAYPPFAYEYGQPRIVLTEGDFITSYDADRNVFIQTIPDESEIVMKHVNRIDAETLNALDAEGLAAL